MGKNLTLRPKEWKGVVLIDKRYGITFEKEGRDEIYFLNLLTTEGQQPELISQGWIKEVFDIDDEDHLASLKESFRQYVRYGDFVVNKDILISWCVKLSNKVHGPLEKSTSISSFSRPNPKNDLADRMNTKVNKLKEIVFSPYTAQNVTNIMMAEELFAVNTYLGSTPEEILKFKIESALSMIIINHFETNAEVMEGFPDFINSRMMDKIRTISPQLVKEVQKFYKENEKHL